MEDNAHAEWDARAMAVHAAMIDRMDQGIGQVIDALEKTGQLDNTLILFLSDNGCSNENCQNYSPGENDRPDMTRKGERWYIPIIKRYYPDRKRPMLHWVPVGRMWQTHLSAFGKPNPMKEESAHR